MGEVFPGYKNVPKKHEKWRERQVVDEGRDLFEMFERQLIPNQKP